MADLQQIESGERRPRRE